MPHSVKGDLDVGRALTIGRAITFPPWTTGTVYTANQTVGHGTHFYLCLVGHTAGTFATDLASGYWELESFPGFEASTGNIKMNGSVALGTSGNVPDAAHVHPIDTSRAPVASPVFTGGLTFPPWVTGATYTTKQNVEENNLGYICLVGHTAGTFATDLASGYWQSTGATFETSTGNIKMNGAVALGSSGHVPDASHVHPVDTSRAPIASPSFTGAISADDITLNTPGYNFTTLGTDSKHYTGVPKDERIKFKIAVSYSAPNVVVSISFVSPYTSFSYYINGKKYTVTDLTPFTGKTATAAEGIFFVYIDKTNTFTVSQVPWTIIDSEVELWNFYFNTTNNVIEWVAHEKHTAGRDIFNHARNHSQGALYRSGFAVSQYNGLAATSYASNTDNNFGRAMVQVSNGSFWDEDILNQISHSDTAVSATTAAPETNWDGLVYQFLGFTELAAAGTTSTSIVFPASHTLASGQDVCVMNGNTTTVRGTTSITTGGTGTTFAVTAVTGMTTGDAIVIGGRIRTYYIWSVVGATYTWRPISATSFLGVTTAAATWTRSGTTVTVTFNNHGEQTGQVVSVLVSSDANAIPLKVYAVTRTGANTFEITGVATGASSGTLTYYNTYNTVTIANGVAQYNNPAGGFSAMTANRYYCVYIIATNLTSEPLIAVLGQGMSTNATLATALGEAAFQFQNLVGLSALNIQEIVPLYRLTFQYNSGGAFTNTRIKLVDATFINIRIATASAVIVNPSVTSLPAQQILNDVTNFGGILTSAQTTVQSALERIDDYAEPAIGAKGTAFNVNFETNVANIKDTSTAAALGSSGLVAHSDHVHKGAGGSSSIVMCTANTTTAYTVDLANGTCFNLTLNGDCTFTFPSAGTAAVMGEFWIYLKRDATPSRAVTWDSDVKWPMDIVPALDGTASTLTIFHFTQLGNSARWYGEVLGMGYTI